MAASSAAQQQLHQDPSPSSSTRPPPPPRRRVPPPCWTHEETSALIDAYHDKWYSLRRGNLKASHWQEVSDSVTLRCNLITPSKTSVQCRHKIEKLRKRYRNERQQASAAASASIPHKRFSSSSSWVYFKKMDFMEKGPIPPPPPPPSVAPAAPVSDDDDEEEGQGEDGEEEMEAEVEMEADEDENDYNYNVSGFGFGGGGGGGGGGYNGDLRNRHPMSNGGGSGGGFRLRIPSGRQSIPNPNPIPNVAGYGKQKNYGSRFDEIPKFNPSFNNNNNNSPNPGTGFVNGGGSWAKSGNGRSNVDGSSGGGGGSSGGGGRREKREMDPIAEMVDSIKLLGEGFVKMETMKIQMARDMEHMRMEMEMKRTEMILESQQRIVDAFTKGFVSNKKVRRTAAPDS